MLEFIMYDIHPEYPVFPNFHLHSINTVIQIIRCQVKSYSKIAVGIIRKVVNILM